MTRQQHADAALSDRQDARDRRRELALAWLEDATACACLCLFIGALILAAGGMEQ